MVILRVHTLLVLALIAGIPEPGHSQPNGLPNPLMFVTQVQMPGDFTNIGSTFGNQQGGMQSVGRGGDLFILYPDGVLRNLTQAAGYGNAGFQGAQSIAVRNPSVHWSGTKALFSMVIGAPTQRYQVNTYHWQIYEITGLGENDTPVITRIPNQPANFNNISPIYGSDDRIIFTSDRPRTGQSHLYPQRDEYESAPTVTGLWSLDPASGDLFLINHAPSGSFSPYLDSYGRLVSTRWDHLQRDQQNDAGTYDAFNWTDESTTSTPAGNAVEVFPEPRIAVNGSNVNGHRIELFLPWQINEDGTEEETIDHVGRHELGGYFDRSFNDDPNLREFIAGSSGRRNANAIDNIFQIRESPTAHGYYVAVSSPTFYHHAAGTIVMLNGSPAVNADSIRVTYLTPDDFSAGHFRNPLPMSDGSLIASYTSFTGTTTNLGNRNFPRSPFRFRLVRLQQSGQYWVPVQTLTQGVNKSVNFWDPDELVTYPDSVAQWEFDPVEVVARTRPQRRMPVLPAPEQQVLTEESINVPQLVTFMRSNNLALVVSRNVTTRDHADRQQPFNLRVQGSSTQTTGTGGKIYGVSHVQFFQGDQLRSYGVTPGPGNNGRRVLAWPMHDAAGKNPPDPSGPAGSVKIAEDGSMAAFVPARRAMTWQLTDSTGSPVVRERFWVSFAPGEIRSCASCHGINSTSQAGNPPPQNPPQALRLLMQFYRTLTGVPSEPATPGGNPRLIGNYPNPFNPSTRIRYAMPAPGHVRLVVSDILGRTVATLVDADVSAGEHEVEFGGVLTPVASGIYFCRLSAGGVTETKKMVMAK